MISLDDVLSTLMCTEGATLKKFTRRHGHPDILEHPLLGKCIQGFVFQGVAGPSAISVLLI